MSRPSWITRREWAALQARADRTGQPVRVKRLNPSRRPRVGEIWRGIKGDRCRILSVIGTQVTVLQLDTGHRVTSEMNDFLATYKPPAGARSNPHDHVSLDLVRLGAGWVAAEDDGKAVRSFATHAAARKFQVTLLNDGNYVIEKSGPRFVLRYSGPISNQGRRNPEREPSRVRQRGTRVTTPASPDERIAALRRIVSEKQYAKIDGKMVDLFSASAILSVYDAISEANKIKFAAMPAPQMAMIAFRVLKKNPRSARPGNDRDFAVKVIRDNLKKRSGKPWSVTVGRGTAWGWLHVDAPNARRTWRWRLKPGMPDYPENYKEYDAGQPGGHMGPIERAELAGLLGLERLDSYQGISIPGAHDYYEEYMDRAQGKTPERIGKPYWDNPSRTRRARFSRASRRDAPRGVSGLGSRRAARAIRSGRTAKAHHHMMSTAERGRFRPSPNARRRNRRISKRLKWSTYAGGTGAWEGAHGYDARTPWGTYMVGPVTTRYGRRAGYIVRFHVGPPATERLPQSMSQPGLYRELGSARSPNAGKAIAAAHHLAVLAAGGPTVPNPNPKRRNVRYVRTLSPLAQRKALAFEAEQTTRVGAGLKKPAVVARARVLLDAYLRGALQGGQTVSLEEVKSVWLTSLIHAATEVRGRPNRRVMRHKTDARRRANPRPTSGRGSEMARARRTSKMWHEFPASGIRRVKGDPKLKRKTLVGLGELMAVDYRSNKYTGKMETYTHSFKRPRPILATDPDAQHLHIVGGKSKVTADGLVN